MLALPSHSFVDSQACLRRVVCGECRRRDERGAFFRAELLRRGLVAERDFACPNGVVWGDGQAASLAATAQAAEPARHDAELAKRRISLACSACEFGVRASGGQTACERQSRPCPSSGRLKHNPFALWNLAGVKGAKCPHPDGDRFERIQEGSTG